MRTIKDEAQDYSPKKTKNIADLEEVPVDFPIEEREIVNQDGTDLITYKVIVVKGEDYRVPDSVLKSLKEILKIQKDLKFFRVIKSGEGMKTTYTVIPINKR